MEQGVVDNVGIAAAMAGCHIPKFWNVKINKIRIMYVCIDLKFHRELKLFEFI
jgi:hypothetical protein